MALEQRNHPGDHRKDELDELLATSRRLAEEMEALTKRAKELLDMQARIAKVIESKS